MSAVVNNRDMRVEMARCFREELRNATRYNSFVLEREIYFPEDGIEWGTNTRRLYRAILTAMAEKDFVTLYQMERPETKDYPNIVSEGQLREIKEKSVRAEMYYDREPFYIRDDVKYYLHTHKSAADLMARVWTYAKRAGWFIEVNYELEEKKGLIDDEVISNEF